MALLDEIVAKLDELPKDQLKQLEERHRLNKQMWTPNVGPQKAACDCMADELFYGGEAGGGKTDLCVGLALTRHDRSLVLRRTNKEASKLVERFIDIKGDRNGWNGQQQVWHLPDGRVIDIGGVQHEDDKQKYKGTPHDLICFDEVSDFSETQYRFIIGWNRTTKPGQRCRVVCAGNPPTTPEGLWVLKYWGPWLDPTHPNPAMAGEIRWFTTIAGEDCEVDGQGPHEIDGEMILARSRTFIRARLEDNPDLARTNYASVLAALPPELRAAYKEGRFDAGLKDHEWQVVPTKWIMEAQDRWTPRPPQDVPMTAIGVDVAQGGADKTILAPRYDYWYDELVIRPGAETPNPSDVAALVVQHRRNSAAVVVDCGGGYGGGVVERLKENGIGCLKFLGSSGGVGRSKDRTLGFSNKRAESVWRFREALDPDQPGGSPVALPPSPTLRADLASYRWKLAARGVQIGDKREMQKEIGRSPDEGDAVVMAWSEGDLAIRRGISGQSVPGVNADRPSFMKVGHSTMKKRRRR